MVRNFFFFPFKDSLGPYTFFFQIIMYMRSIIYTRGMHIICICICMWMQLTISCHIDCHFMVVTATNNRKYMVIIDLQVTTNLSKSLLGIED